MKKVLYHSVMKAFAWILLFVSFTIALASTALSVYYLSGGVTKTDNGYESVFREERMESMLHNVLLYYRASVEGYYDIWYNEGVEYYEEFFDPAGTSFRFHIPQIDLRNSSNWYYGNGRGENTVLYSLGTSVEVWYGVDSDSGVLDVFFLEEVISEISYEYRYYCMAVAIVSILLTLGLMVYLFTVAGRKEPDGELSSSWIHRIPYEILVGVWAGYVVFLVWLIDYLVSYPVADIVGRISGEPAYLVLMVLAWGLMFGLTAMLIHSMVVRVRRGGWYRTFFIYRIARILWRCLCLIGRGLEVLFHKLKFFVDYLPLYVRFAICYLVLTAVEIVVIVACDGEQAWMVICWCIYKAVLMPLLVWYVISLRLVEKYGEQLAAGNYGTPLQTKLLAGRVKYHAQHLHEVESGLEKAVSEKIKSERMKTELITNVSHDIKTPLTSIINYVDLLKKEDLQPEVAKEYVEVLERQSARLKKLTEDVIEASKAASGAITTQIEATSLEVLLPQVLGEYEERMASADLYLIQRIPEKLPMVMADARLLWRVLSNLLENAYKYSQRGTRVYFTAEEKEHSVQFWIRNISAMELNVNGEELMERFVRGDDSRNTEGSGLGLSIAKSLLDLMHGEFSIQVDGDLFKVLVTLPKAI